MSAKNEGQEGEGEEEEKNEQEGRIQGGGGCYYETKGKEKRNMRKRNKRRTKSRMEKRKGHKEEAEDLMKLKINKKENRSAIQVIGKEKKKH